MERRELFSSFFSSFGKKKDEKPNIIRPPYFIDESFFDKECINCDGVCSIFCEEKIIFIREDKTPMIDFNLGGCTYCDECAKACPSEVLKIEHKHKIKTLIEIDILKCMSWHSTMCFSCKDPCLENAIQFLGMFRPTIDTTKCTNCGFCVRVCPSSAIDIKNIK